MPTLSTFKNMLKTHLFSRNFFTDCFPSTRSEHYYGVFVVTLAMLLRLRNCRFIIITIIITSDVLRHFFTLNLM